MVKDGVGILKVGPETTFQLREGLFAFAELETELAPMFHLKPSHFKEILEHVMVSQPEYWEKYYHGTAEQLAFKRKYSYSDRSRYYLALPEVAEAANVLLNNLASIQIPLPALSQYFPIQYEKIRCGILSSDPFAILEDKVQSVIDRYYQSLLHAKNVSQMLQE